MILIGGVPGLLIALPFGTVHCLFVPSSPSRAQTQFVAVVALVPPMTLTVQMQMHVVLPTELSLADFAIIIHVLVFDVLVEILFIEESVVTLLTIVQVVLDGFVMVECSPCIVNSITDIAFKSHLKSKQIN